MSTDFLGQPNRSRYGIYKLMDDNNYSGSWNCELLPQEREVWSVVDGATIPKSAESKTSKVRTRS
jgi:hypothetical protein